MTQPVTAILITKEPEYPKIVLERLTLGFFQEIVIETNCPHIYRRYELAAKANTECIYFQDDDALLNYQVLFKKFDGRITNTMTDGFQQYYEPLGCTLVGWGCFFPKSMISVFDRYIEKYGYDEHLYREADRIFTYLNKPFNTIIMPHEDVNQDGKRMSNEPEHFPSAYEALRKCELL